MASLPPPRPIALIAPRLDTGLAARAMQACAELLAPAGYYLAAAPWQGAPGLSLLNELRPAAALVIGPLDDPGLRSTVAALEVPVVETWSASAQPLDGALVIDNAEAGRQAARHLAAKRHARVACISTDNPWERARREGFVAGAAALGLEQVADIVQPEVQHMNDGRMAFLRLLSTNTIFDAVFCSSDLLAGRGVRGTQPGPARAAGSGGAGFYGRRQRGAMGARTDHAGRGCRRGGPARRPVPARPS